VLYRAIKATYLEEYENDAVAVAREKYEDDSDYNDAVTTARKNIMAQLMLLGKNVMTQLLQLRKNIIMNVMILILVNF